MSHNDGILEISHVVQISYHMRDSPIGRNLHPSKRKLVPSRNISSTSTAIADPENAAMPFDFLCGQIRVLTAAISELQDRQRQRQLEDRIRLSRPQQNSKTQAFVVLVLCDVEEPHMDVLSWLNEVCLARECSLQMAWSNEDAARLLEGLVESASVSTDFVTRRREDAALPALIDALTQPGSQITRQDALKLANKFGTVADILMLAPDSVAAMPGFGPKKSKRVGDIFRTPFAPSAPSQGPSASDVVVTAATRQNATTHRPAQSTSAIPAQSSMMARANRGVELDGTDGLLPQNARSDAFTAALKRYRRREDADGDQEESLD